MRYALVLLLLLVGCGDDADPSPRTRCHQKGGVWIRHYKARNVCIKREVVIDYEGDE